MVVEYIRCITAPVRRGIVRIKRGHALTPVTGR